MKNNEVVKIAAILGGGIVGGYFLHRKLTPPSLIVEKKDDANKSATINFDGTVAVATLTKAIEITAKNGYVLKVFPKNSNTLRLDLYRNGERVVNKGEIYFS